MPTRTNLQLSRPAVILRQRKRIQSPYLRGPIPLSWIRAAADCKSSALAVGLMLWFFKSVRKAEVVKLGLSDIGQRVGLSEAIVRRSLGALSDAGLITIVRAPGRKSQFQILIPEEVHRRSTDETA